MKRFLFVFVFFSVCCAFGADKYVDPVGGSDDNGGTNMSTDAYATIDKAWVNVDNRGTIYLKAGTYDAANQSVTNFYIDIDIAKSAVFRPENEGDTVVINANPQAWLGAVTFDVADANETVTFRDVEFSASSGYLVYWKTNKTIGGVFNGCRRLY